jgi:DNA-binding MarR family transcriptional regulator
MAQSDDSLDDKVGPLLAMAQRMSLNCYSAMLEHLHLTPAQAEILHLLSQHQMLSIGTLAEIYRVKPPVMTAMVDGLVRLTLVERRSDPHDRRRSVLAATEQGRQIMHEVALMRDRMQNVLTAALSEQETLALSTTLQKVIRSMEKIDQTDVNKDTL